MSNSTCVVFVVLALGLAISIGAEQPIDQEDEKEVLFEVEDPTCYRAEMSVSEKLESQDRFVPGDEIVGPVKVSGRQLTSAERNKAFEVRARPVIEVVIGDDGRPQLIVPLKPVANDADRAMAQAVSEWRFEPASRNGQPVCIRYILTSTIHYWE